MGREKTLHKRILEVLDYEPGVKAADIGVTLRVHSERS